jgi:hypothetical protein
MYPEVMLHRWSFQENGSNMLLVAQMQSVCFFRTGITGQMDFTIKHSITNIGLIRRNYNYVS